MRRDRLKDSREDLQLTNGLSSLRQLEFVLTSALRQNFHKSDRRIGFLSLPSTA
jgi:hypothetical protein